MRVTALAGTARLGRGAIRAEREGTIRRIVEQAARGGCRTTLAAVPAGNSRMAVAAGIEVVEAALHRTVVAKPATTLRMTLGPAVEEQRAAPGRTAAVALMGRSHEKLAQVAGAPKPVRRRTAVPGPTGKSRTTQAAGVAAPPAATRRTVAAEEALAAPDTIRMSSGVEVAPKSTHHTPEPVREAAPGTAHRTRAA